MLKRRKPETLALFIALVGTLSVLLVFVADLIVSRSHDLEAGQRRLQHFSIMMAENTARSFESVDIMLRETATDLSRSHRDWPDWEERRGWDYVAQRHSRGLPQLRDLIVFDQFGNQRFMSTHFPAPHINIKDRQYFNLLEAGAETTTFGPFVGRNSGNYTYALARRLNGDTGQFTGVLLAAIDPAYFQDFCWPNRLADDFESVLINRRGEIVSSCRPTDFSEQSPLLGAQAAIMLYAGKLPGPIPEHGLIYGNGYILAVSPVPGVADLRVLTTIPEEVLLNPWHSRMVELATLGSLVTIVLVVGALLIRRQVSEMSKMTDELAAGHQHLEERVHTATQELAGQKEAAELANTAKSRFLAAASHDLRQPLHALSLFSADLQHQVRSNALQELPRLAEQIAASTTLLGELLDSLLDISRLDVAGVKPDRRPTAIQPIFERLADSYRRAASDRQMILRFRPCPCWVDTDPVMLERMIANLISNALRYANPRGRILVTARRRGDKLLIEVRDNGIGIAPEHQQAIFNEFYQVGNAAREQNKGLGLGLSIIDRLARALDIKIGLRSRIGGGTNFSLLVPGHLPLAAGQSVSGAPIASNSAGKVFCFGASPEMLECIHLISRWDYQVSNGEVSSGELPPADALLITDAELATLVCNQVASGQPLIVLQPDPTIPLPEGAHALALPIRPAKLRALLAQLQKTLSKSMR